MINTVTTGHHHCEALGKTERPIEKPEITAKVAKSGCRIYEVGISYSGRTYNEGKKIAWKDGVRAMYCIVKYNVFR